MSKARSPRAVCSTTIGTRAICFSVSLENLLVTELLYFASGVAGSYFFIVVISCGNRAASHRQLLRPACRADPHRAALIRRLFQLDFHHWLLPRMRPVPARWSPRQRLSHGLRHSRRVVL